MLCVAAIALAATSVGGSTAATQTSTETIAAQRGVVQSTVTGTGTLEPASELDLGFKTAGTVSAIYVHKGEHVVAGQLIAVLDPASVEVTLEQARASLKSAEASLIKEEEDGGESSSTSSGASSSSTPSASTASVSYTTADTAATPTSSTETTDTTTSPTDTTTSSTTPSETTAAKKTTTAKKTETATTSTESSTTSSSDDSSDDTSSSTSEESTIQREANLEAARATVKGDKLTVKSAEESLAGTKLYAPKNGTIVSLSGETGETVSATGTTKVSTSSDSSSSDSTGTGSSATGSVSTGSSSASSSSSFAVLSDLESMHLSVSLSESEVSDVKAGQAATVSIEALSGHKEAAEVLEVAEGATSSSDVVTYEVTFGLNQLSAGVKTGMTATVEVVVKQAEGVNVPTRAVSDDSVTVVKNGKDERRTVVVGLAGDTNTIITSGLNAGEDVVLPVATASSGSSTTKTTTTKGTTGTVGGGTFGGGFAGAGAGGTGGSPPGGGPP